MRISYDVIHKHLNFQFIEFFKIFFSFLLKFFLKCLAKKKSSYSLSSWFLIISLFSIYKYFFYFQKYQEEVVFN